VGKDRVGEIDVRGLIATAFLAVLVAVAGGGPAGARSAADGAFKGRYTCGAGLAGLTVTITSDNRGRLRALLRFYDLPQNPGVPSGTYRLTGRLVSTSRQVTLIPQRWVVQPPGYTMTGIAGVLSRDGRTIAGRLTGDPACGAITLTRQP
jgi:hypothetical protein